MDAQTPSKQYFGLDNLDEKLEKYLNYDNGFFVELGANDGVNQSNTFYYELFRNWTGVLIEPIPHNYFKCKSHRSNRTKVYCNACTSFDFKEKFVEIIYSNLMSISKGLETDIVDQDAHAEKGRKFLDSIEENISFGAVARTLNEILKDAEAPELIDFLSLDVEGAEIDVLKGINHDQYKFKFMCIECRSIDKLLDYLLPRGYQLVDKLSEHDYVFAFKRKSIKKFLLF